MKRENIVKLIVNEANYEEYYDRYLLDESQIEYLADEIVKLFAIPDVSGSFLCDGCNVREPWEHRCHGGNCTCDNPVCMERQGRITHDVLMEIVNKELSGGK